LLVVFFVCALDKLLCKVITICALDRIDHCGRQHRWVGVFDCPPKLLLVRAL
jgi:hypothetical protein